MKQKLKKKDELKCANRDWKTSFKLPWKKIKKRLNKRNRQEGKVLMQDTNIQNRYKELIRMNRQEYSKLLGTGMFFELYPELSGDYDKDLIIAKEAFESVYD